MDTPPEGPLVFLHLQKTGGSTVHRLLQEHLPPEQFAKRNRVGELDPAPKEELRTQVISGHVTAHFVKKLGVRARVITVLRDPVDRLLSHFHYLKSYTLEHLETFDSPLLMRIKPMNLATFLTDPKIISWFQDFYVQHLDPEHNRSKPRKSPQPDVSRALEFLQSCQVVGITPRLTEFVRTTFSMLGLPPNVECPFVNRRLDLQSRAGHEPVATEIPTAEDQRRLEELTRNDRILYDYAVSVSP